MDVKVDCYAGHRGEETPRRLELGGRRVEVVEVIDRWLGPDHRYFKVRGDDGAIYLLRRDDPADRWELKVFERGGPGPAPRQEVAMERFRDRMWGAMEHVFARILVHPFVAGLTDGSLPRDAFAHYVVQDALYLVDYARALALVGVKAPDEEVISMFAGHARGALEVERSLHAGLFRDIGLAPEAVRAARPTPTTLAYTSYLLASCHQGSFAEGLGAVLPCYWIYAEVGSRLLARSSPDPLYARWIATYGGEEFGRIVADVLALVDRVGAAAGAAEQAAMRERVVTTARYEWMFWDASWRRESWPV